MLIFTSEIIDGQAKGVSNQYTLVPSQALVNRDGCNSESIRGKISWQGW